MTFDLDTWKPIAETMATALFTAGTVIAALWKRIKVAKDDLLEVKKQMTPNGGASLADKVNKVLVEVAAFRRALMDLVPDPMYKTNSKGSCIWVNLAYTDKFGIMKEATGGLGWTDAIHSEDKNMVKEEFLSAVVDCRMFDLKYRMKNKITGQEYKVHSRAVPILDDKEQLVSYLGIINIIE